MRDAFRSYYRAGCVFKSKVILCVADFLCKVSHQCFSYRRALTPLDYLPACIISLVNLPLTQSALYWTQINRIEVCADYRSSQQGGKVIQGSCTDKIRSAPIRPWGKEWISSLSCVILYQESDFDLIVDGIEDEFLSRGSIVLHNLSFYSIYKYHMLRLRETVVKKNNKKLLWLL